MDRRLLEGFLAEGLSLGQIGERVGRHPSTVSYWLKKYGLEAAHKHKHAARGGIARGELESLVSEGLTYRAIAEELGLSYAAVRHWAARFGLQTRTDVRPRLRRAAEDAPRDALMECRHHGSTKFRLNSSGYYKCLRCRAEAVKRRRRRVKAILVEEAGGKCRICGYDRCVAALEFHHLDPSQKEFSLSLRGITRALAKLRAEASKCVLLCSTCHAEVEAGFTICPR